jgi:hypothetical protein
MGVNAPFFEILNYETSFWDWPYISYMLPEGCVDLRHQRKDCGTSAVSGKARSAHSPNPVGHRKVRSKIRTSPANCSWSSIRSSFRHQLGSRIPPTLSPRSARFAVSLSVREKIREKSDSITNLAYIPGRIARKGAFSWQLVLLGENPIVRKNFLDSGPRSG